ncbi:hypothetical protein [Streptomyces xiamenensis]
MSERSESGDHRYDAAKGLARRAHTSYSTITKVNPATARPLGP